MPVRARSRPVTLAGRIRLATVGVAALSALVAFSAFYVLWSAQALKTRTDELSRQVSALASGLSAGGPVSDAGPDTGLRARLLRVQAGLIGARLLVVDGQGRVTFSTFSEGGPQAIDLSALSEPDSRGVRVAVRSAAGGERLLLVAAPLEGGGHLVGAQTLRDIARARGPLVALLVACLAVALLVAWVVGGTSARRLTAPLDSLRRGAEAIAAGRWDARVDIGSHEAEIATVADAFNEMARRLQATYHAQKAFVWDVSHEIRTPIASIAGYAQAIADGTAGDAATVVRFARTIRDEAKRLAEITTTLLSLADFDSGRVAIAKTPVDVHQIAEALRSRYAWAGDRLTVGPLDPDGARPIGDAERLLQVATALIDNALKHGREDGRVVVSAEADGTAWSLVVDDDGPGIPSSDRERIFERFVRLDAARTSGGGSGLGLAIAKRIVDLMGGTIEVGDAPLGGARFVVRLPVQ